MTQGTADDRAVSGPFDRLDAQLRRDGYRPGRPAADVAADDQLLCTLQACRRCRATRLDYRPYLRFAGDGLRSRYRMLAVCRRCGEAEEF
jgi:hypothetical protein